MVSDKQIEVAADQISEGLGAFLRKFCDSEASKLARYYLHEMPKDEWNQMALMLATEALTAAKQAEPCSRCKGKGFIKMGHTIYGKPVTDPCPKCAKQAETDPIAEPVACVERGSEQSTPQPESRLREARLREALEEIADHLVTNDKGELVLSHAAEIARAALKEDGYECA